MTSRVVSMLVFVRFRCMDFQHCCEIFLARFGRLCVELLIELTQPNFAGTSGLR